MFSVLAKACIGILCFCCLFISGCTSGADDSFGDACGIVLDGEFFEDVDPANGQRVTITSVLQGNLVIVRENESNDLTLVLLSGIAPQTNDRQLQEIESVALSMADNAVFFRNEDGCTASQGALTELVPGTIFFETGQSLAEELLMRGLVQPSRQAPCGGDLLLNCYQGIALE